MTIDHGLRELLTIDHSLQTMDYEDRRPITAANRRLITADGQRQFKIPAR